MAYPRRVKMSSKYVRLGKLPIGSCLRMQSQHWEGWLPCLVVDRLGNHTAIQIPNGEQFAFDNKDAGRRMTYEQYEWELKNPANKKS